MRNLDVTIVVPRHRSQATGQNAGAFVRVAVAQTPEFLEDLESALAYLLVAAEQADAAGTALLCLPEGFLQGYLTDGEAARRHALDLSSPRFSNFLQRLPAGGPMLVIGLIETEGDHLFNTAAVVHRRTLLGRYRKRHLLRSEACFQPGNENPIFEIDGLRFGINICFDCNFAEGAMAASRSGATLLLCPANNMLPKRAAVEWRDRHNAVRGERCRETGLWLMSADVTGHREGYAALGPTAVLAPTGEVVAQLPLGEPGILIFDIPVETGAVENERFLIAGRP